MPWRAGTWGGDLSWVGVLVTTAAVAGSQHVRYSLHAGPGVSLFAGSFLDSLPWTVTQPPFHVREARSTFPPWWQKPRTELGWGGDMVSWF